jgi:hypothetical protein
MDKYVERFSILKPSILPHATTNPANNSKAANGGDVASKQPVPKSPVASPEKTSSEKKGQQQSPSLKGGEQQANGGNKAADKSNGTPNSTLELRQVTAVHRIPEAVCASAFVIEFSDGNNRTVACANG